MANIRKAGKRFQVLHGKTGQVLSTFSTEEKARDRAKAIHKKTTSENL